MLMVQQHLGTWLTDLRRLRGPALTVAVLVNELGGLAAPLFLLVSGAALGRSAAPARVLRIRGLGLLALGFATNLLTPRWFGPTSFYVLHLLGLFSLLAPELRRLSANALLGVSAGTLLASVLAQHRLGVALLTTNEGMRGETLAELPFLTVVGGHFPLLPWLAFPVVGLWFLREPSATRRKTLAFGCAGASTLLLVGRPVLALALPRRLALRLTTFQFYPATLPFLLLVLAAAVLVLGFLERREPRLRPDGFLGILGHLSLTIFVVHIVLFREWVPRLLGAAKWEPALVLGTIVAFLAFAFLIGRSWRKAGYRGSLEGLLRALGRLGAETRVSK